MDKLSLISGALFLAADIFAVAALAMPDWIVTEVGGDTRLGLMQVLSLLIKLQLLITLINNYRWDLDKSFQQTFITLHCTTTSVLFRGNLIPN